MDNAALKKQLREYYVKQRGAINLEERRQKSVQACKLFSELPWILDDKCHHIAIYFPANAELDPMGIIINLNKMQKKSKTFYLPKIDPDCRQLKFLPYFRNHKICCELTRNEFGIPEPHYRHHQAKPALDVIVAPVVSFTQSNPIIRLGHGCGYYDATLGEMMLQPTRPIFVGMAYDNQKAEQLPIDTWDIPMDFIVTENSVWPIK